MESFVLLAYASLAASRTLLQPSELYFRIRFTPFVQMKKVISMNYGNSATQAAENHGDEWTSPDTFYEGYIHQFQPEPTHKIH